jgi:hypothetical protein
MNTGPKWRALPVVALAVATGARETPGGGVTWA